ncbi:hypothetical protein QEH59_05035 [Coraliomargarita sp. SDUM461004]|uniref:PEP-CTERM protein-sorting domain-containing protein n=1 Tax=Thalassobacterium sedimentorum TaxID=3041258 RepID=A0ABU1AG21_9BACT|nr:PEP-CTERM sorting domain-containing protein [Coraliomargarita sp. SDUM461004]MDQ8193775.1 hypothetical protein [Coraliomargarita sp. SDUM461004]
MKQTLITALLLTGAAAITSAETYIINMDGGTGTHRYGTGKDALNDDVFESTLGSSVTTEYLGVGYANNDDGEVRRAMMKWDLSILDEAGLSSSSDIQSVILTIGVTQYTSEPDSDLWVGQDLSITSISNPTAADFNEGYVNGFFTGVTAAGVEAGSETVFDIDITDFVRNDYDNDNGDTFTTLIFFLENEDIDFTDHTAQYRIGAGAAVNVPKLTISTIPEPSQFMLGLVALGTVAIAATRRRRN